MRVGPLTELILYVQDMGAQVAFYRDVLGLGGIEPAQSDDYGVETWVTFDLDGVRLVLASDGDGEPGSDGPALVFQVVDLDAWVARLRECGIEPDDEYEPSPGARGVGACDPEGFPFHLVETPFPGPT